MDARDRSHDGGDEHRRLIELARVLDLVTAINKEIVRVEDARELFVRACRIAVERARYRFAWVGLLDRQTGRVQPDARFGHEDGYLDKICIDLNDPRLSAGPTGRALLTGEHTVISDITADAAFAPWRENALRRGYGSCAAFPLRRAGDVIGSLNIYAHERAGFDGPSVQLLCGLADDMSFALDMLDREERRREAEAALRVSEERYRTVIEQASDGIYMADASRRFIDLNSAAQKLTGYSREEVLRMHVLDLQDPVDVPPPEQQLPSLPPGVTHVIERRIRRKDGSHFVAEIRAKLLPDGREQGFVRDVTGRKQMEAQLALAQRMASVGRLAAGVAHEINNPLAYVVLNLELAATALERMPAEPVRNEVGRALAEARQGSERVRRIVRSLGTMARGDEAPLGPVDVHRAIDEAADIAEARWAQRARLVKEYGATRAAHGDSLRLGQVLVNLLVNAADAIAEGAADRNVIRVRTFDAPDGRVGIDVVDTGSGVPEEVQPHMFDPFFTTKPVGAGTGLGLSICHGIVSGFGGEIRLVESGPAGSTFRVLLAPAGGPAAPPAGASEPPALPPPSKPPGPARARVLVVDDEPAVAGIVAHALDAHAVTVASSGSAALALCREREFDVILCDVTMPGGDGIEFWEGLRADGRGFEARVGFMTGGTFTQRAREFLARVPNRCLEKPFTICALEAMVDAMLAERSR
jgi:PAS domain S-box-containing protein